MEQSSI